jgi:hypothetical protein
MDWGGSRCPLEIERTGPDDGLDVRVGQENGQFQRCFLEACFLGSVVVLVQGLGVNPQHLNKAKLKTKLFVCVFWHESTVTWGTVYCEGRAGAAVCEWGKPGKVKKPLREWRQGRPDEVLGGEEVSLCEVSDLFIFSCGQKLLFSSKRFLWLPALTVSSVFSICLYIWVGFMVEALLQCPVPLGSGAYLRMGMEPTDACMDATVASTSILHGSWPTHCGTPDVFSFSKEEFSNVLLG